MNVIEGATIVVVVNVRGPSGAPVDADTGTVSGVLAASPSIVPSVVKSSVGEYLLTFAGISPALTPGQQTKVTVSGAINGAAFPTWEIPILVVDAPNEIEIPREIPFESLGSMPRKVAAGSESVEEHSLPDQIAFQRYLNSQKAGTDPESLPIRTFRQTHGRP